MDVKFLYKLIPEGITQEIFEMNPARIVGGISIEI